MRKFLKILLYVMLGLLVLLLALSAYLYFNRDQIKQHLLTSLNESLDTKIEVNHIGIDLFHNFPRVGLDLEKVAVHDAFGSKTHLLDAGHIYIGFDLLDLINKNYRIRKLGIDSGQVNILVKKDGSANYLITKSDSSAGNEKFLLDLQQVETRLLHVTYRDLESAQLYEGMLNDVTLSLKLTDTKTALKTRGRFFAEKIKVGKVTLLKDKDIRLDGGFTYDSKKKQFAFGTTHIDLQELKTVLSGQITNTDQYTDLNLEFTAQETTITGLLSLLPFKNTLSTDWESSGNIFFRGSVKGRNSKRSSPVTEIIFGIEKGALKNKKTGVKLHDILCNGTLDNKNKTLFLSLSQVNFRINNSTFAGALDVSNFDDPFLTGKVSCNFEANDLIRLTGLDWCREAQGQVSADLLFAGSVKAFTDKNRIGSTSASGHIRADLKNIRLTDASRNIESLHADMNLQPSGIGINSFTAGFDKSDISIKGTLQNIFGYLLKDQVLTANITYHSNYVDPEHFVIPTAPEAGSKKEEAPFTLPANIVLESDIGIDQFVYQAFRATGVKGHISWTGNNLELSNASAASMGGQLNLSGQLAASRDGRYMVTAKGNVKNVSVTELFRQCKNFGQKELTDKHLKGQLSSSFELVSVWSRNWDCDMDKLYMIADVTVNNGEINNYEPLLSLSRYARVEDLKNLKFATLQNKIEIREQTITIPEMTIYNNALNLSISGTHTFKNYLDYRIRIRLTELLKRKRGTRENEFGEEEEGEHGMSLFLTMKGPIDHYKIEYDKIGVKKKIIKDVKQEGRNITETVKKDLGIGRDSSIKEKQNDNDELEFEKE